MIHSRLSFSEPDDTVSVSISPLVNDDLLVVGLRLELSENLEFLGIPGFELVPVEHLDLKLMVVS